MTASGEGWDGTARIRASRVLAGCARINLATGLDGVLSRIYQKYENKEWEYYHFFPRLLSEEIGVRV